MTHEEAFTLMMDALDRVLSGDDWARLDAHLALCADCCAEWAALRLVDCWLSESPTVAAPVGFVQRVEARLTAPALRRNLGGLFVLGAGSVAVLLTVAIPAAVTLLGLWRAYADPSGFAQALGWLVQLIGVGGSLAGAIWTAARLILIEASAHPVVWGWAVAAALAVAIWAHLTRQPAPAMVFNGELS